MGKHWRLITTNPKNLPNKLMTLSSGETISYEDRIRRYDRQNRDLEYTFNLLLKSTIKELNLCVKLRSITENPFVIPLLSIMEID